MAKPKDEVLILEVQKIQTFVEENIHENQYQKASF